MTITKKQLKTESAISYTCVTTMAGLIQNLTGIDFFNKLDSHFDTPIPTQIKNILLFNDYDSLAVLKDFDEDCFTDVQQYMRNVFDKTMLEDGKENVRDYLGRFEKCQTKFEFTSGQKQWLVIIVTKCNELSSRRPIPTVASSNVMEHNIEALRKLLQNWTFAQESLIEVTHRTSNVFDSVFNFSVFPILVSETRFQIRSN